MFVDTRPDAELHILLVEDDQDDVYLVERVLKRSSHLIYFRRAMHGREAIDYITRNDSLPSVGHPELIILDLNMPVMSGQEFLAWLRARPEYDGIQVVVLTTSREREVLDEVIRLGANAALSKEMNEDDADALRQMIIDYWFHGNVQFNDEIMWTSTHAPASMPGE